MSRPDFLRRIRGLMMHVLLIASVPRAWIRSLSSCRPLFSSGSGNYMGFRPKNALNSLFYRTQWLNIRRYGRYGHSPIVGFGDFPLGRWIHISRLSHGLYANFGAATMLLGTIAWAASHLVWLLDAPWWWVVPIAVTLLFSTTAYSMAFVRQNYNILGWLWVPIALYSTVNDIWLLAAAAWFAASMASLTVVFVAVPLMFVQAAATQQIGPVVSLTPALAKLVLHFIAPLRGGGLQSAAMNLARHIGLIPGGTVFRRVSLKLGLRNGLLLFLYATALAASWLLTGEPPWLPGTALFLFAVNQRFLRFADSQSVIIFFLTVFAAHTLAQQPSFAAIVVFVLAANPLPYVLGLVETDRVSGKRQIPVYAPYDHSRLVSECDALMARIPEGSRVLMAFDDPEGIYEEIFDGYRTTLEPLLYAAARRGIHLFPDWHAVTEMTAGGDFSIWGRTPDAVQRNCRHWHSNYALLYLDSEAQLPPEWQEGFVPMGYVDFGDYIDDFDTSVPWDASKPCVKYHLMSLRR